ncbi:hypothetical protein JP31_04630 [Gallibacterium anatis]|nr:hypothetical protein JP31_04630 [Gallibacterium anatis]KGQ28893.1 hypothetical protein JP27_02570 [Gallibacterium anatis]
MTNLSQTKTPSLAGTSDGNVKPTKSTLTNKLGDSTMSTLTNSIVNSQVVSNYASKKDIIGLIKDPRCVSMIADAATALKLAGKADKELFKQELKQFFHKLQGAKFMDILKRELSDDDIIAIGTGKGTSREVAERNVAKAIRFANKAYYEQSRLWGAISQTWGHSPEWYIRPTQLKLPCYAGWDDSVKDRYLGWDGVADPVEFDHVSIKDTYQRMCWGILNKMMAKLIIANNKVRPVERWKQLVKEFVTSKYAFDEQIERERITFDVAEGRAQVVREITTRGSMTAYIERLEEQIFKMENPVNDRGEEQVPYAYDVRGLNEALANAEAWRNRYLKQLEFFEKYESVMIELIKSIKTEDVTQRADEARKASGGVDPYEIRLVTTKEFANHSFKDEKGKEVYLFVGSYNSPSVVEACRANAIENARKSFVNKERENTLAADKAFSAFGFNF